MTAFNLRSVKLRPGERYEGRLTVELDPVELGGQSYAPVPPSPEASLVVNRLATGTLFELALDVSIEGACFRCLEPAAVPLRIRGREYQADSADDEELQTPYVVAGRLDLSSWARDAVVLALPEKILCRDDCAGLCARCGADLNRAACTCGPPEPDPRFEKLRELL